jgi:DNA-binding CsgD family transcriptional regulator/sugar-specific transcriptional regulator TrmB
MPLFLGLPADAEIIYRAMIKYPGVREAAELAQLFGWPGERVANALNELERYSLVRQSWEKPGEFLLVSPEVGLAQMLSQREADLHQYERDIADSRAAMARLISDYNMARETRGGAPVEQLTGLDSVRLAIEGLAKSCTSEIMAFAPDGPQTEENMATSRPLDQELLERGIRLRTLYLESIANDTATMAYARWLVDGGAEVRLIPSLPTRMAIYDRSLALVAIDPDRGAAGAILMPGKGVLSVLCAYFDQVWETATELGQVRSRDDEGLTTQEREILRMLAEGNTDELVARRLGISVRTTRRLVAELASRLSARSRFQLGVLVDKAGWLRLPREETHE